MEIGHFLIVFVKTSAKNRVVNPFYGNAPVIKTPSN